MRQTSAVDLKKNIDRADRMDDKQIAQLRADVKVILIFNNLLANASICVIDPVITVCAKLFYCLSDQKSSTEKSKNFCLDRMFCLTFRRLEIIHCY